MKQLVQNTMTPVRQNTTDEELAKMVARDLQPFQLWMIEDLEAFLIVLIQCM